MRLLQEEIRKAAGSLDTAFKNSLKEVLPGNVQAENLQEHSDSKW